MTRLSDEPEPTDLDEDRTPEHWHELDVDEVARRLDVDPAPGLSAAEAAARQGRFGPNELRSAPPTPAWKLLVRQFTDGLIVVLFGAAILSLAVGEIEEAAFIFVLLVFNGVLGFWQERQAQRSLAAIEAMVVAQARVRREGRVEQIPATDLVPGDVILLEAGDTVPADARIAVAARLAIAEAALTGEAVPVDKGSAPVAAETVLGDRSDMVFTQTAVTAGRAEAIVVATAMDTEIGRLAGLMAEVEAEPTPLQRQTTQLGHRLAALAGVAVVVVAISRLADGESWSDVLVGSISLAVAAIPEALPATVTVTLAIGMSRLAKRHAVVKRLHAVETLGSTSVICTDKTGTLTLNQMTVQTVVRNGDVLAVEGQGYSPVGRITSADVDRGLPELRELGAAVSLCNDAVIRDGECIGDPTEGALVVFGAKAGIDVDGARRRLPRVGEVPFDSTTKYMATFHEDTSGDHDGQVLVCVKGAVESVLERVDRVADRGGERVPLGDPDKAAIRSAVESLAGRGQRVLAAAGEWRARADVDLDGDLADATTGLVFLGLVGIVDPPRGEAGRAIAAAHRSGIDVKMITGDHPTTAHAIADALGITGGVVQGAELETMDDRQLAAEVRSIGVFARVAPEHKLRIVRALQSHDLVVSMTGDGVNDAPALEQADIGVAMGITGTEVTKEAADMILLDDDFSTIVVAVREGRTIYENIVKFVRFQLSTNLSAIMTVLAAGILNLVTPFTTIQILWVNLICDGPPALALGVDPPRPQAMDEPPRPRSAQILPASRLRRLFWLATIMGLCTLGVLAWADHRYGAATAATMGWTTFVLAQLFNLFNARAEHVSTFRSGFFSNGKLWLAAGGVLVAQIAIVHVQWLRSFFDTTYLDGAQFAICLVAGSLVLWLEELRKLLVARRRSAPRKHRSALVVATAVALGAVALAGCSSHAGSSASSESTATPSDLRPALTALGDSVPAGSACDCTPYPQLTGTDLAQASGLHVTTWNDAVPGDTTAGVVHQLETDDAVIDHVRRSGVVLVEIGANDVAHDDRCGTDLSCYEPELPGIASNLRTIDERVRQLGDGRPIEVVFLDYWSVWLGGSYATAQGPAYVETAEALTAEVNRLIRTQAEATHSIYVDLLTAFRGPDQSWDETHLLASDGDHPNAAGHRRIADATEDAISRAA
jgi:Ca2+-transporting ATPase